MNLPNEWHSLSKRLSVLNAWRDHRVEWVPQTGSTNDDLKILLDRQPITHCLKITDYQTAGRGQRGRSWIAEPATSLLFSFTWLWQNPDNVWLFPLKVGVALHAACRKFVSNPGALWLKWPNDLCLKNGKLAGVLIESVLREGMIYAVVGIGLNIEKPLHSNLKLENLAMPPAALLDEFSVDNVVEMPTPISVLESFAHEWDARVNSTNAKTLEEYTAAAQTFWKKTIKIMRGDGSTITGTASHIAEDGSLMVLEKNGRLCRVNDACRIMLY